MLIIYQFKNIKKITYKRGTIKLKLYNHQLIKTNQTQALYWDMGLGKTYAALNSVRTSKNILIICPAATIPQWMASTKKMGFKNINIFPPLLTNQINIVSYNSIWREKYNQEYTPEVLILDESQKINNNSKQTKKCLEFAAKAKIKLLLSGTPCDGKYEKLYNQLKVLGYNRNKIYYMARYCKTQKINFGGAYPVKVVVGYKLIDELRRIMEAELHINIKHLDDVNLMLPDTQHQWEVFDKLREEQQLRKEGIIKIKNKTIIADTTSGLYHALRQLETIVYNKKKKEYIVNILESTNSRVIMYYNYKCECESLTKICEKLDKPLSFMNGEKHDLSNYEIKKNSVTLVQYESGAAGLNLQKAHYAIFASPPVSSINYEQAKARIHRIGQENKCIYYHPTVDGIEKQIYKALKQKIDYTEKLFRKEEEEEENGRL